MSHISSIVEAERVVEYLSGKLLYGYRVFVVKIVLPYLKLLLRSLIFYSFFLFSVSYVYIDINKEEK